MDEFDAGDVCVVGGGAAGLVIAESLVDTGLEVTMLERRGLGAEQSNHSHGYLHRGHIYSNPSTELVSALRRGADSWHARLEAFAITPHAQEALVAFVNPHTASVAHRAWTKAGLRFSEAPCGATLDESVVRRAFVTEEATFDFTRWLECAADALRTRMTFVRGEADALIREGGRIAGVVARVGNRDVVVKARHYVLAGGIGNLPLISTATNYRGNAMNRLSYMLVLEGPDLPASSLVMPDQESYGLFLVSRTVRRSNVWLVSNFLSFSGDMSSTDGAALWLRATARGVRRFTQVKDFSDLRWGLYPAPKGELRSDRRRLDVYSAQSYGLDNLTVASPSKLTLVPLLAEEVRRRTLKGLHGLSNQRSGSDIAQLGSVIPVVGERWRSVFMNPGTRLERLISDSRMGVADGDNRPPTVAFAPR